MNTISRKNTIILIIAIVTVVVLLITTASCLLVLWIPNTYAEAVPIPTRVINEEVKESLKTATDEDLAMINDDTIFVATTGDDDLGDGSERNPYSTIDRARIHANDIKDNGADVLVLVREGEYLVDDAITFTKDDNGSITSTIIYRNYPGEYVVLNSSKKIDNWTEYKDGIYVASFPESANFNTISEDGIMGTKARYPNAEYLQVENQPTKHTTPEPQTNSFIHAKDQLISNIDNWTGIEVKIFAGGPYGEYNWFSHIYPVTSYDKSSRTININRDDYTANKYFIGEGSRYFLQNSLQFLDQKGEYYIDSESCKIYYMPLDAINIAASNIYYSTSDSVINFNGTNGTVENITIEGFTIKGADIGSYATDDSGIIKLNNTNNIVIKYCKMFNGGKYGVIGINGTTNALITKNHFYDIGHTAVQINGSTTEGNTSDNIISYNDIHDTGLNYGHGAGIQLMYNKSSEILNNTITRTPRYSISLKGVGTKEVFAELNAAPLKALDYHYGDNIIAYNDCSMANLDTQDTGVIELFCAGANNQILNNYIHDSYIYFSFGAGLYIDDYNVNTIVRDNIFYNLGSKNHSSQNDYKYGEFTAVIFAKFYGNVIENNYMVNCAASTAILLPDYTGGAGTEEILNTVVNNNLVYNCYNSQYLLGSGTFRTFRNDFIELTKNDMSTKEVIDNMDKYIIECENNLVYADSAPSFRIGSLYSIRINYSKYGSIEKFAKNTNLTSMVTNQDPIFLDIENFLLDYDNSPCKDLNIKQIDFSLIGC